MKKKKLLSFILCLIPFFVFGQWNQLGTSIVGDAEDDRFGYSTRLNDEGDVMVIGAYESNNFAGYTRVFELNGGDWTQRGSDIQGLPEEWSGFKVDIDATGNTIAIASVRGDDDGVGLPPGVVRVFDWDGINWLQRGIDLKGIGNNNNFEMFGSGLCLSADGNTLAIGAPKHSNYSVGSDIGFARILTWDGGEWIQLGDDIFGEVPWDELGISIDLNESANVVAIGAHGKFDFATNDEGYVKIFDWDGTNWNQLGSRINGEIEADEFGGSVSLNALGDVLAVGAPGFLFSYEEDCNAYVFTWNGVDWVQRGSTLIGLEDQDRFGTEVSLNSNGNILAVGAPQKDGIVQIFEWIDNSWIQIGINIVGEDSNDRFGNSLSMNGSGNTIAIGGWANQDIGHVRVFKNESIVGINSIDIIPKLIQIHPNPTKDDLKLMGVTEEVELSFLDLHGKMLLKKVIGTDSVIDLNNLHSGVYILKVQTSKGIQAEMIIKQ